MAISPRNKIAVRWSVDPALVGYARTQEQAEKALQEFRSRKPNYIGSPRTALERYQRELNRNIGHGTYHCVEFSVCATGEIVSQDDLRDVTLFGAA